MNVVILLCFLALASGNFQSLDNKETLTNEGFEGMIDGVINATFNKVIKSLKDPLELDLVRMNFSNMVNMTLIDGAFNISNLRISGVQKIVATKIASNVLAETINMTISIPDTVINFKYWADVVIGTFIPFYGNGVNNINMDDLKFIIFGKIHIIGGIKITNVQVQLSVGSITFDLNGILDNPELSALLNVALNDNVGLFINAHSQLISKVLSPIVQNIINSILKKTA